jgi:GT2 family glycosyltransferase
MRKVLVSVVNTANRDMLRDCLVCLETSVQRGEADVYVVDNASDDGSAEMVASHFPWAHLVRNERRLGFSANHNQVIGRHGAGYDYALVLNEDTVFPADLLPHLVAFAERHPQAGIVAPRVVGGDGALQYTCLKTPTVANEILRAMPRFGRRRPWIAYPDADHYRPTKAGWVNGCCMLLRMRMVREIGSLDDAYFIFYEEVDLARRAAAAGWEAWLCPDVELIHHGHSTVSKAPVSHRMRMQMVKSRCIYFRRHHSTAGYVTLRAALSTIELVRAGIAAAHALRGSGAQRREWSREAAVRARLALVGPNTRLF